MVVHKKYPQRHIVRWTPRKRARKKVNKKVITYEICDSSCADIDLLVG